MRKASLIAALAMSTLAGAGFNVSPGANNTASVSQTNGAQQTPADRGQNLPSDTKSDRLGAGYYRRHKAPVGKRYSASVRQHQRHALKARRQRAAR